MRMGRLAMRHVREVMRLKAGLSIREIGRRVGAVPSTVRLTIRRFEAAGLSWPLADEIADAVLEEQLFAGAGAKPGQRRRAEPDWAAIDRELTVDPLGGYIASEPHGYRYSRFCELYRTGKAACR
ncbi:transposase [Bradyrhizobium sp. USDA 3397]